MWASWGSGDGRRGPKNLGWRRTSWVGGLNRQRWGSPSALPCQSAGPEEESRGSENGHTEPHMCHVEPPSELTSGLAGSWASRCHQASR